jgi:SEC-C motif
MKPLIITLLIIFGIIIVVGLGSVLLVLWAYGAGQVMLRILPSGTFNAFEATLLNQVGVLIVGMMVIRIVSAATSYNPLAPKPVRKDSVDEEWEEDEDFEGEDPESEDEFPGIPRWRQPLKKIDFTDVKPNDACPCGSGRKFKNCHGYKRTESK